MARKKFDYDSSEFSEELFMLAFQGLTDAEIADSLSDKFKQSLSPEVFCRMKNGKYEGWDEKMNARRSERISQALARGRRKINSIVRGAFLKSALGGKKVKSASTTTRRIKLPDGTLTGAEDVQTTETEQELPPNMQALSTWLFNHDQEWRQKVIEGKKLDVTTNGKEIGGTIEIIDKSGLLG